MSDFISQEAVLSAISTITIYKGSIPFDTAKKRIEEIPTINIIHCKNCIHWFNTGKDVCSCDRDALLREKDFFCAAGECPSNKEAQNA